MEKDITGRHFSSNDVGQLGAADHFLCWSLQTMKSKRSSPLDLFATLEFAKLSKLELILH